MWVPIVDRTDVAGLDTELRKHFPHNGKHPQAEVPSSILRARIAEQGCAYPYQDSHRVVLGRSCRGRVRVAGLDTNAIIVERQCCCAASQHREVPPQKLA